MWQTTFAAARPVRTDEQDFVLAVPSTVVRERIEGRYLTLVNSALVDAGSGRAALVIVVHTDGSDPPSRTTTTPTTWPSTGSSP